MTFPNRTRAGADGDTTLERESGGRLDFFDDDARAGAVNAGHLHQTLEEELLQLLVAGHDDLQEIVELARQEMALEDLAHGFDAVREPADRIGAVMGEHDVHEAQEVEPHGFTVNDCSVTPDDTAAFQLSEALLQPRTGKLQLSRQVGRRAAR